MQMRRHFKQSAPLDQRLPIEAERLRKETQERPLVQTRAAYQACAAGRDCHAHERVAVLARPSATAVSKQRAALACADITFAEESPAGAP